MVTRFGTTLLHVIIVLLMYVACSFPVLERKPFHETSVLSVARDRTLQIEVSEDERFNMPMYPEKLLYLDDDIIVVDKPPNIQTAPGFVSKDSLATKIAVAFGLPRIDKMIVHRLDYATSGVLIFARNDFALSDLHKQFRIKNRVFKSYIARVDGRVASFEGEIDLPIARDTARGGPYFRIDPVANDAKPALTRWDVLGWNENSTDVRLRPITGRYPSCAAIEVQYHFMLLETSIYCHILSSFCRTHQLRLHMAAIGHPIIGDKFYAPVAVFNKAQRLLLHAEQLHVVHPRTKCEIRFVAANPFPAASE